MKYNGWLISDNIIKRSLAVWWHAMLWYIFLVIIFFIIIWILFWGIALIESMF